MDQAEQEAIEGCRLAVLFARLEGLAALIALHEQARRLDCAASRQPTATRVLK